MTRFITLLIAVFIMSSCCIAQQKMGWELGLISTDYISTDNGNPVKLNAKPGLRAGFDIDFKLAHNLSLQSALLFVTNGYRQEIINSTITVNVQTLEIPVMLQYWPGKKKGQGFFAGGGGYIAYNISGQVNYNGNQGYYTYNHDGKLGIGNTRYHYMRPLDFGGTVNAGYEFRDGIFVKVYYQLGLCNLSNSDTDLLLNRNFGLCVGYMVGTRPLYANSKKGKKKINRVQKED